MSDTPNLPRLYGEKEIGQILKRATELQHDEPTAPTPEGMSLQELEEIAREAGIDPTYLRRAAMELDTGVDDPSFWVNVVGDDLMLVRETRIPGELDDEGFERVVGVIQANTSEHGQPSLVGRTLTWRGETPNKTRTTLVSVISRDGYTDVRLEDNLNQFAGGLFGGVLGGVGGGLGIGVGLPVGIEVLGSVFFATAFPIGVLALSTILCRNIYRGVVKGRRRKNARLFDQIVAEVTSVVSRRSLSEVTPAGQLPPG